MRRMIYQSGATENGMNGDEGIFSVEYCRGFRGCPRAALDGSALARLIEEKVTALGNEHSAGGDPEAALYHRKFRVSLSLCPNACSRPQIADFGVIGAALPGATGNTCTGCNVCTGVCREGAISPRFGVPVIDYSRCVSCGECARACPCGSIEIHSTGFRVLVGGRLGRHPRLARELGRLYTAEETAGLFERSARLFLEHCLEGRRFAELLDRYDLAGDGLRVGDNGRFAVASGGAK